jgi:hypothetical protein
MIRAVVNIDFGTHGVGFAWTFLSTAHDNPAQRKIFTSDEWPGQPTPYPKTLSCLILDRDGEVVEWGWEAHRVWRTRGTRLHRSGHRLKKHFKMSLARSAGEASGRKGIALDDAEDSPQRLIIALLSKVRERALEELGKSGYQADEIRWCLTVPAIWDDYQKHVMRQAAHEAGLPAEEGRLILALEPEAAAHYARVAGVSSSASDDDGSLTTPGARYMVVDCGGGTVDITAYRNDDNGMMVEIGRVYGGSCGSAYLNKAFEETVLIKRLGGVEEMDRLQQECPVALEELLDAWERAKLHARVDSTEPLYLSIGAALDRRLSEGTRAMLRDLQDGADEDIVVTPDEVRTIFEQVIPEVLHLIDEQMTEIGSDFEPEQALPVVLLAGGFGASAYLQERVTSHLAGRADVRLVPNPAVAVLSGGVHFAYEPQTRARRSKYTYGTDTCRPFSDGIDPPGSLYVSTQGVRFCEKAFDPFVRAGETVRSDQVVTRGYLPTDGTATSMGVVFYATREPNVAYSDDPGCHELAELEIDLSKVMHLPQEERAVRVAMKFGETEIKATVTVVGTDICLSKTLSFTAK